MPGIQKGKKHKPGAGRPPLSAAPTVRVTVTLPTPAAERLKALGGGNASAGVRRLLTDLDQLREWLDDYGRHNEGCVGEWPEYRCRCGWREVERRLDERPPPGG